MKTELDYEEKLAITPILQTRQQRESIEDKEVREGFASDGRTHQTTLRFLCMIPGSWTWRQNATPWEYSPVGTIRNTSTASRIGQMLRDTNRSNALLLH